MSSLSSDTSIPSPDVPPDDGADDAVNPANPFQLQATTPPLPDPSTLPPLGLDDAPFLPGDQARRVGVRIDGTLILEKGACIGTRRDMQSCDRPVITRRLCRGCYQLARRKGEIGRITLEFNDVNKKFIERSPIDIARFADALEVSKTAARRWLVLLEQRGVASVRLDDNDGLPRWHLSEQVRLRMAEPAPPKPPRPAPPPPPGRRGRPRKRGNQVRDTMRGMAAGWPEGF